MSGRLPRLLPVRLGTIAKTPPKWPVFARIRSRTRSDLTGMRCGRAQPRGFTAEAINKSGGGFGPRKTAPPRRHFFRLRGFSHVPFQQRRRRRRQWFPRFL
jgi:hypothetical protein